jgi:CRISPR/Cas system endoribonuclease Cas6 (RAMP superfamily)
MLMGGITGTVTYRGEIGPYIPLLKLAKQLHLGKQTAFGLGQIDYHWLPE